MASIKELMREPKQPKRNFLIENRGHIHLIEEQNRKKDQNCKFPTKNNKYSNIKSKVQTRNATSSGTQQVNRRHESTHNYPVKSKFSKSVCDEAVQCDELSLLSVYPKCHQSTQTSDDNSEFERVLIPSSKAWDTIELPIDQLSLSNCDDESRSQYTQRNLVNPSESQITLTDQMSWSKKSNQNPVVSQLRAPTTYQRGVVPRYLRERQVQQLKEAERAINEAPDPDCPPGHRKISEEERIAYLSKLKASHQDLIVQLNQLPVHLDTLRAQKRRRALDEALDKIDQNIVLFSRPKVFIPIEG